MPTVLQFRRGTTAQNNSFTGSAGELTIDTTIDTVRVHDGSTAGGFELTQNTATQTLTNKTLSSPTLSGTASGTVDINITGTISASGAVTGSQFNGSGAGLTSIPNGALTNSTISGVALGGTLSTLTMNTSGTGLSGSATYNGSGVSTFTVTSNATSANTASAVVARDASGNFSAGTITATLSGAATTAGTVTTAAQPNITSVGTLSSLNVSGAISAGGTVTGTSFIGVATSAQYADLAENYLADAAYIPGTVLEFGGELEVTIATTDHSTAVAGIVSTQPAYLMNSELKGVHPVSVALTGRVPCLVQGPVKKGTVLVSGVVPGTAMAIDNTKFEPGCVVGKAMSAIENTEIKTIEVAVGRL